MVTKKKFVWLRRVTPAFVTGVGVLFAGCQTLSYTEAENDIYNHFEQWSQKLPEGMRATPAEQLGQGAMAYSYQDGEPPERRRQVRCIMGGGKRELMLVDIEGQEGSVQRFAGFWADPHEMNFNEGQQCQRDDALIADLTYYLQSESEATVYFREKGTGTWRRCGLAMMVWSAFTADRRCACLEDAEEISAEQVRRYVDLADRFYQKYFFLE